MEPNAAGNGSRPWAIPEAVRVAEGIDLTSPDPALHDGRRRCIALARTGDRCRVNAIAGEVLCTAHAGRLDSAAGGKAKAARHLEIVREAESRMVEARLGARAVIAARAIERAQDLRAAFDVILDNTLGGDKTSARTLLGYLQAAFPEAEQQPPRQGDAGDLTTLTTAELRALALTPSER